MPDQYPLKLQKTTPTNKTMDDEHTEKLKAYKKKQKLREKNVGIGTKVSNLFENRSVLHFQNMYSNHLKECGFTSVAASNLGEMRLFVFAKSAVEKDITAVENAVSCTGLGHVMANKEDIDVIFIKLPLFLYPHIRPICSIMVKGMKTYGKLYGRPVLLINLLSLGPT